MAEPAVSPPAGVPGPEPGPTFLLVHLSGAQRGASQHIQGDMLTIGTGPEHTVRVVLQDVPEPALFARLVRRDQTYELRVEPDRQIWVNGTLATRLPLAHGDTLEIGKEGPVLRFRVYRSGLTLRAVPDVLTDSLTAARLTRTSMMGRTAAFLSGAPVQLVRETSRAFRWAVGVVLLVLAGAIALLLRRSIELERQLVSEQARVAGIAELLARRTDNPSSSQDLLRMLGEVEANLSATSERLQALEAQTGAAARVIRAAARSTVFLQGAYGFTDPQSGRPLRIIVDAAGDPQLLPSGDPLVTLDEVGPELEVLFTGTAFVATASGLLFTNRHVAAPWEFDEAARRVAAQGWRPVMRRFVGFLPDRRQPVTVELLAASDDADLAVLRTMPALNAPALALDPRVPEPGDEVISLGYPLGLRALMARADARLVSELRNQPDLDFWAAARRLAQANAVAPLATRGIVGQVTDQAIVYDAETTHGGSGGPVLSLQGAVLAVSSAVLPEFGGSNLGVPAAKARALLRRAGGR